MPFVGIAQLAASAPLLAAKRSVSYQQLPTRRLINRCASERMPFEWTINPYRGCEFGCKYCYARYTHQYMELREPESFETQIFAKQFLPASVRSELASIPAPDHIAIGTATDPYQPAERRFRLTRSILKVLATQFGRKFSITTKSDLIADDVSLLTVIAERNVLHVNFTVTTMDPALARLIEPRAPRPDLRVRALAALAEQGISAGVFASPILPCINDSALSLTAVAEAASKAGARYFGGGVVFLQPSASKVFLPFLEERFPELASRYRASFSQSAFLRGPYVELIRGRIRTIRERSGLASSPVDYQPDYQEPQLNLFDHAPAR
jgi:DNA repair photolyase